MSTLIEGRGWRASFRHTIESGPRAGKVTYDRKSVICWEAEDDSYPVGLILDNDGKRLRSAASYSNFTGTSLGTNERTMTLPRPSFQPILVGGSSGSQTIR